jgi:hypothetical protein
MPMAKRARRPHGKCRICTPEKRAKILAALTEGASISRAAVGVPRSTLYLWRRTDKLLPRRMAEALECRGVAHGRYEFGAVATGAAGDQSLADGRVAG